MHDRVEVVRSDQDLERLWPLWDRIPWQREEAEHDYFVTRLSARPDVVAPFAIVVTRGEEPIAALAGRVESRRLATGIGYRTLYAPRVRLLQVLDGGIVADDADGRGALLGALRAELAAGTIDAVAVPPLPVGSDLFAAFESLGGPLQRQRFIAPWTRRRLVLPATFDEFVASRSANTRWRIRRDAKRLVAAHGDDLTVAVVRDPDGLERLVRDADRVALSTYQHALGAGFSDTPEQRALARVGLEHGWLRGYLLYLRGEPIAYWLCSTYHDTMLIRTGGFDNAHAYHRVGLYLLMRTIEDACEDPSLRILDFGPGDAAYKQQFSNESWRERNLLVFAPTRRGLLINAIHTAILGAALLARRLLDAAKLTDRVRSGWRGRLRRGQ